MDGKELTAFLSRQDSPEEADSLAEAYHTFLLQNGGTDVSVNSSLGDAALVNILDSFELIFHHGQYVTGVHEAENQEAAEKLGLMLEEALVEAVK